MGQLTYDSNAKQLRFTGVMTTTQRDNLKALAPGDQSFGGAVTALFDAPRKMVGRQMSRFSVPRFATPLASLPGNIVIPNALKSKVFFDTLTGKLNFVGIMTDAERKALIDAEPKPPVNPPPPPTPYVLAIEALYAAGDTAPTGTDVFITKSGAGNDVDTMFSDIATAASRFLVV